MLRIYFGAMQESVYNPSEFFRETYDPEWLQDDFARRVIRKIDEVEVLSGWAIRSDVLGVVSPWRISGGTKTLLLIKNRPDKVFNASFCGDNCARFILELARERDVTINLRHIMDFGKRRFTAVVLNDGRVVHGMYELLCAAGRYV